MGDVTAEDFDAPDTPEKGNRWSVSREDFVKGLSIVNEMKEKGLVEFQQKNGDIFVTPTAKAGSSGGVSTYGDGKNGYEREKSWTQMTHELHIDAEKSEELAEMAAAGAAVSAIASAALAYSGVGSLAAPATAVLSALLGFAAAQYATEAGNNGTITKLHMLYSGQNYGQIDSQDEDNEGFPYT